MVAPKTENKLRLPAIVAFVILALAAVYGQWDNQRQNERTAEQAKAIKVIQLKQAAVEKADDIANCEESNSIRTTLLNLFNGLRPQSEILRPGETAEQYRFRLEQNERGYQELNKQLAPKDCVAEAKARGR